MAKPDYLTYAAPLSAVIDLAVEALQRFPPPLFTPENLDFAVIVYRDTQH